MRTVLIGAADLLPVLEKRLSSADKGRDLVSFSDRDSMAALEAVMKHRPAVVALERMFASTSRGTALINRIKADPSLASIELQVVAPDDPSARVVPRESRAEAAAAPLDRRGTQTSDAPVTVGLVIDNSSSMQDKRADVIDAARLFAESSNPQDQIFLVRFNEHVALGLPAGVPFTSSVPQLTAALSTMSSRGMTALYDAIAAGVNHLREGSHPRKALVIISDGGDDASRMSKDEATALVQRSNAVVYTIGLFDDRDADRNPGVLKRLAGASGGRAYFPRQVSQISTVCRDIAATLRASYTLGYVANGAASRDGRHTVRVLLTRPDAAHWKVTTRPGYTEEPRS